MSSNYCHLWLTCADEKEATVVAAVLLEKKLIACAKHLPVGSDFLWKGSVDHNDETFVMSATPIERLSQKALASQ